MVRLRLQRSPWLLSAAVSLVYATSLQQLSLEQMTSLSTEIVRGKVSSSYATQSGDLIYTHYQIQVTERWKGAAGSTVDVAVPGGTLSGMRQSFAGVPTPIKGSEYVFFLWRSPKGITQLIGLQQGLFDVSADASGVRYAGRNEIRELMLGPGGKAVTDRPVRMRLAEMRSRVQTVLGGGETR